MRTLRVRHEDTLYGSALTKRCMRTRRRLILLTCYGPHRGKPRQLLFEQSRGALDSSCVRELAAQHRKIHITTFAVHYNVPMTP
ncbi:hypothetical protein [Paenibacillus tyrfis]|uniref:hypothetical protein n=1 Tax=Paenibacillus tyrfis TaxID=1501230 RepID=UPI002493BE83|nr:hypothetical protein [Paenibacillus tyrfis]